MLYAQFSDFVVKLRDYESYCLCPCADFEDMSCEMVYGQVPPPFEEDPVVKQPCFADICKFFGIP